MDGGYLFAGESGKDPAGGDAWIVKLDGEGGVEGSITLGGANPGNRAASAVQVSNAEYAFAGTFNATEKGGPAETDAWVVKLSVKPQTVPQPSPKPPKPPKKICPPCPVPPEPRPSPASIGDFVWNDTNADGIQDPGEPGVEGVNVTLLDAGDREIALTMTDADGKYLFANLTPGNYTVKFAPPEGLVFTVQNAGTDDTRDSDANRTTGMTERIALGAGEKQLGWDAGLIVPQPEITGRVGGLVWTDANEDGIRDDSEAGLPGASVSLYTANNTSVNTTETDAAGRYLFAGLPPGDYYLVFGLPPGYAFTAAGRGGDDTLDSDADPATGRTENFTISKDETEVARDAGAVLGNATIGDFVWNDTDANGIQDDGEPGVGGVTVRLLDAAGSPVTDGAGSPLEATTGDDGRYALQGKVGQTYILEFVLPEGAAFTTPNAGDDALDSDADPVTGRTEPFELTGDDLTRDAGVVEEVRPQEPGLVTGTAWNDTNANGARDADELGVPDVGVELVTADGTPTGTTTTGDDGGYTFSVDEPGTYLLRFAPPGGFGFTAPGSGSDVDPATGRTDEFDVAPSGTVTRNAGLVGGTPEEEGTTPPAEETVTPEETTTTLTPEETETVEQTPPADLNATPEETETGGPS
ncbi:carboxypeptidase regulatory-like domain-containing protein [Methanoculleus sp. 7T]|nr:carboxypeptidase regulatory-like domain-containing protein [Methanoculleus sp. 7T]